VLEVKLLQLLIKNAANYNLKIDGITVANSGVLVGNQVSLFGTCEEIQE